MFSSRDRASRPPFDYAGWPCPCERLTRRSSWIRRGFGFIDYDADGLTIHGSRLTGVVDD
jgi:hypothetical protein